jgi:DNA polymerase-4
VSTETPILHVDMDAFFVSVELVHRPELRGRPVVVGGEGDRGVVAAASYEARAFGVRSAMPSTRARRLCPDIVFLRGDHRLYGEVSGRIMEVFRRYTPLVEPLSLDEAFLDVSGAGRLHGSPEHVASAIRADLSAEELLTCSVGVAPNKFLAKLASGQAKPKAGLAGPVFGTGIEVVVADGVEAFLDPLPVQTVWGVGPRTFERLERFGVRTVADLRGVPADTLVSALGRAVGSQLWRLARGIDDRAVEPEQVTKSIGHEETFARDLADPLEIRRHLVRMVDAVARRARSAGVAGRTVSVKLRYPDFTTMGRSHTLADPTDLAVEILEVATGLVDSVDTTPGIRLLGVSLGNLQDGSVRQLRFNDIEVAEGRAPGWRTAEGAVDEIRERFGNNAIGPAVAGELGPKEIGDSQWGPDV